MGRAAAAATTATAATVAAAHPAGSNRLAPKDALQRRAGGRWKRDASREMGAGGEPAAAARRHRDEIKAGEGRPGTGRATRECASEAGSTWRPRASPRRAVTGIVCPEVGSARSCRVPRKILDREERCMDRSSTAPATANGAAMPAKHQAPISDLQAGQPHSTASVGWSGRRGDLVQLPERLSARASSSAWRRAVGVRAASAKEREHDMPDRPSPSCCPIAPRQGSLSSTRLQRRLESANLQSFPRLTWSEN